MTVQDMHSTTSNSAFTALQSTKVRSRQMITRASSFIHCAGGLEKEHFQGGVMPFGRISAPPKNAKDPPTCIRLFSEKNEHPIRSLCRRNEDVEIPPR